MTTTEGSAFVDLSAEEAVQLLLGATSPDDFFSAVWETQHLWTRGADNRALRDVLPQLLTLETLDELLTCSYARGRRPTDSVVLMEDGRLVQPTKFMTKIVDGTGQLDVRRILDLYGRGASIAVNSLHTTAIPVSQLCQRLSQYFGATIHANAYITPPNSQGFSLHYDTHDVFLIQIFGQKEWEIVGSSEPLRTTIFTDDDVSKATGCRSFVDMSEGDVLYVPRGMFHEGRTSDHCSAHLTIGVHPYTWADFLRDILDAAVSSNAELRMSVAHPPRTSISTASADRLIAKLFTPITSDQAEAILHEARSVRLNTSLQDYRGHLSGEFLVGNSR